MRLGQANGNAISRQPVVQKRPRRRLLALSRCLAIAAITGSAIQGWAPASSAGAAPPTHAAAPPAIRSHASVVNPHLHGVSVVAKPAKPAVTEKLGKTVATGKHKTLTSQHWGRQWHFVDWIKLHRGLGTITGTVVNTAGQSLANAHVWLKHPNGNAFKAKAMKHITNADASGNFTMSMVRAGRYRVVATKPGVPRNHAMVHVTPGAVEQVKVRI